MGINAAYLLRKLFYSIKSQGLTNTLRWAWFGCAGSNDFEIYIGNIDQLPEHATDEEFSLAVADSRLLEQIQHNADFQTSEAFISKTLKCGQCLVGLQTNQLAHIMWIFEAANDSRFFDLGKNEAEINYCYTPLRFRGKGMYQKSLRAAIHYLRQRGIERVYMVTHAQNEPSKCAIAKVGLKHAGSLRHYGLLYRPKWRSP